MEAPAIPNTHIYIVAYYVSNLFKALCSAFHLPYEGGAVIYVYTHFTKQEKRPKGKMGELPKFRVRRKEIRTTSSKIRPQKHKQSTLSAKLAFHS